MILGIIVLIRTVLSFSLRSRSKVAPWRRAMVSGAGRIRQATAKEAEIRALPAESGSVARSHVHEDHPASRGLEVSPRPSLRLSLMMEGPGGASCGTSSQSRRGRRGSE